MTACMPVQSAVPWLSIVPIAESRSSYNGLLVFFFIAASAWIGAFAIHRFASRALRRSPAWDCGFPDPSPATQYTAGSFAQPIRRIFGTPLFSARERVDIPEPGDPRPAHFEATLRDPAWEDIYLPVARLISVIAGKVNATQFLTIRRYLSLMFAALVFLLLIVAVSQ